MDLSNLNFLAILVAAIVAFAAGALWYMPAVFGKAWMRELGIDVNKVKGVNMPLLMVKTFILTLIASISLAMFMGPEADWKLGAFAGFMSGATFIAAFMGINMIYENKSMKLFLINAGYAVVAMVLMGITIGLFG